MLIPMRIMGITVEIGVFYICLYIVISFGWCAPITKTMTQKETSNKREHYNINKRIPTHLYFNSLLLFILNSLANYIVYKKLKEYVAPIEQPL